MKKNVLLLFMLYCFVINAMDDTHVIPQDDCATSREQIEEPILLEYLIQYYVAHTTANQTAPDSDQHNAPQQIKTRPSFQCPICSLDFVTSAALIKHFRYHAKDRLYPCPHANCGYSAKQKRHLDDHIESHRLDGSNPYNCPVDGCGLAFPTLRMMKYHVIKQHSQDRFQCHYCPKKFVTKTECKCHENRIHVKDFRFKCEWEGCGHAFDTQQHLDRHFRSHTQEKPFACPFKECDYTANQESNVVAHIARIHHENLHLFTRHKKTVAAQALLQLITPGLQPSQPIQPDDRLSANYLLNPAPQPASQEQTDVSSQSTT